MRIIRALDVLVIDEISMVRSDLLDAVDDVLRRIRGTQAPFGGVQLLMIGDLRQLSPIVTAQESQLLATHYDTPYFFGSQALRRLRYVTISLRHVFRQRIASLYVYSMIYATDIPRPMVCGCSIAVSTPASRPRRMPDTYA